MTRAQSPARKAKATVTKRCTKCRETKELTEFRPAKRMKDGISSWCSTCHVQATRDWRERNRELDRTRQRDRYRAMVERLGREVRARRSSAPTG